MRSIEDCEVLIGEIVVALRASRVSVEQARQEAEQKCPSPLLPDNEETYNVQGRAYEDALSHVSLVKAASKELQTCLTNARAELVAVRAYLAAGGRFS